MTALTKGDIWHPGLTDLEIDAILIELLLPEELIHHAKVVLKLSHAQGLLRIGVLLLHRLAVHLYDLLELIKRIRTTATTRLQLEQPHRVQIRLVHAAVGAELVDVDMHAAIRHRAFTRSARTPCKRAELSEARYIKLEFLLPTTRGLRLHSGCLLAHVLDDLHRKLANGDRTRTPWNWIFDQEAHKG